MELDHIFLLIEQDGPEPEALNALGLVESFRRAHPGQGTANVCYCFDNAYLELLWVTDWDEVAAPQTLRTRLKERAAWRSNGASPFGISLRGGAFPPFPFWEYRPTYLSEGMAIPVALDSEHPGHPFLFQSPGDAAPLAWTDGRAGQRQVQAGLRDIMGGHLETPVAAGIAPSLHAVAAAGWLSVAQGETHRLSLDIRGDDGPRRLILPECVWA